MSGSAAIAESTPPAGGLGREPSHRAGRRLVGTVGEQLDSLIFAVTGVREVYATPDTVRHYRQQHSGQFDVEAAEAGLRDVLTDPAFIYRSAKSGSVVFVAEFDEQHYLLVSVKCLAGELWLETLFITDRRRFHRRRWARGGALYSRETN